MEGKNLTTSPESVNLHAKEEEKHCLENGYIRVTLSLVYSSLGTLSFFRVIQMSQVFWVLFPHLRKLVCNFLCLEYTLLPSFLLDSHQFPFSFQLKLYFFIKNFPVSPLPSHPRHSLYSLRLGQLVLQYTFIAFHKIF